MKTITDFIKKTSQAGDIRSNDSFGTSLVSELLSAEQIGLVGGGDDCIDTSYTQANPPYTMGGCTSTGGGGTYTMVT